MQQKAYASYSILDLNDGMVWKGDLSDPPENPEINWAYYNTNDKQSYVFDGTSWQVFVRDGLDAQDFYIVASSYTFNKSISGNYTNSITLTAHPINITLSSEDSIKWYKQGSPSILKSGKTYSPEQPGTYEAKIDNTIWSATVVIGVTNDGSNGNTVTTKEEKYYYLSNKNTYPTTIPSNNDEDIPDRAPDQGIVDETNSKYDEQGEQWTKNPSGVTSNFPYEYQIIKTTIITNEVGGTSTWSSVTLYDSYYQDVAVLNTFNTLTDAGTKLGVFTSSNGGCYINASAIQSGSLTVKNDSGNILFDAGFPDGNNTSGRVKIAGWDLKEASLVSVDGLFKIQSDLEEGDNNYLELGSSGDLIGDFVQQFKNGIIIESDYLDSFQIGVNELDKKYELEVGPNIKIEEVTLRSQIVINHDDGSSNNFTINLTPYIYDWEDYEYYEVKKDCSYDGNVLSLSINGNVEKWFYFKKQNNNQYSRNIFEILNSYDSYSYNPEFITAYLEIIVEYKTKSFIVDSEGKITSPTILSLQSHIASLSGKLNPSLTVNNGELIIQKNGEEIDRFSANSSQTKIVDIIVPTKFSELSNDCLATEQDILDLF